MISTELGVDGAGGGDERLAGHLAAERALPVLLGRLAPEDVDLDRFEVEEVDDCVERTLVHRAILAYADRVRDGPHGASGASSSRCRTTSRWQCTCEG